MMNELIVDFWWLNAAAATDTILTRMKDCSRSSVNTLSAFQWIEMRKKEGVWGVNYEK